eukprot:9717272-Prorocentrum_lima.AAC.1
MTSSLVGSEMCIRDRYIYLYIYLSIQQTSSGKVLVIKVDNTVNGPLPVSYTHLTLPTICSV